MERIDDVWVFVEAKLKCEIPSYFKNVLTACGYDNKITIASIDEDDLQYFEQEVRNGNVSQYFECIDELNILEGSTKTVESFEFTRGHKKFLLLIRDFLKHHLKETGPDSLTLQMPLSGFLSKTPSEENKKNQNKGFTGDVNIQQGILMCKIVMSLINTTPEMYAKNMDMINKKISKELLKVQMVDKDPATGTYNSSRKLDLSSTLECLVLCPFCSTTITAIQTNCLWDISGFECHLEVHLHQKEHIENENSNRQVKENNVDDVTAKSLRKKKNSRENKFSTSNNKTPNSESSNHKKMVSDETLVSNGNSDTSFEEKKYQSFSEVLKESVRTLKFEERNKSYTPNSNCSSIGLFSNDSKRQPNELFVLDSQKQSDPILPKVGEFVICSFLVKETMTWPSSITKRKHFVGKVQKKDNVKETEIDVELLEKKPNSNYIFKYPETIQICQISTNDIVKILADPLINRRGGLVFKDEFIADNF